MAVNPFYFTYEPSASPKLSASGYGNGILWLNAQPYWFAGNASQPEPLEWTWLDLLEHLAKHWASFTTETPWPDVRYIDRLLQGKPFWPYLEDLWSDLPDAQIQQEESKLLGFLLPRNLAAAFKGVCLPALHCLRQGLDMILCPEDAPAFHLPARQFIRVLEDVGEAIAAGLEKSDCPRSVSALTVWRQRNDITAATRISLASGLTEPEMAEIQKTETPEKYWVIPADADDEAYANNSLLAAARMLGGGRLAVCERAEILNELRRIDSDPLVLSRINILADSIGIEWLHSSTPYQQGYELADQFRAYSKLNDAQAFDIEAFLQDLGIRIRETCLSQSTVLAIACWGSHGPGILINTSPSAATSVRHARRMALAHELAHLLADKRNALPAADVLDGAPRRTHAEKRANAFAAEVLLPRKIAAAEYRQAATLEAATRLLVRRYGVSPIVAKTQLKNSQTLSAADEQDVDQLLDTSENRFTKA